MYITVQTSHLRSYLNELVLERQIQLAGLKISTKHFRKAHGARVKGIRYILDPDQRIEIRVCRKHLISFIQPL